MNKYKSFLAIGLTLASINAFAADYDQQVTPGPALEAPSMESATSFFKGVMSKAGEVAGKVGETAGNVASTAATAAGTGLQKAGKGMQNLSDEFNPDVKAQPSFQERLLSAKDKVTQQIQKVNEKSQTPKSDKSNSNSY